MRHVAPDGVGSAAVSLAFAEMAALRMICRGAGFSRRAAAAGVVAGAAGLACGTAACMRIEEDVKLDFKDVLIRPKRSTLQSRSQVACAPPRAPCALAVAADGRGHRTSRAGEPRPDIQVQALGA